MATMLSSVTSVRFSRLILDSSIQEPSRPHCISVQEEQMEGIRMLDFPLCRLAARTLRTTRKRVHFVILAQDPKPLALGLVRFHRVGDIWAGEKVSGGGYRWSFDEAEEIVE